MKIKDIKYWQNNILSFTVFNLPELLSMLLMSSAFEPVRMHQWPFKHWANSPCWCQELKRGEFSQWGRYTRACSCDLSSIVIL